MVLSATLTPSVYGLGGDGGIPSAHNVVITYPMAASASVSVGDWVKLSSTTAGTVSKCTATGDNPIGVAFVTTDNSSGSAGDKFASVLRKGYAYLDVVLTASGTYYNTPVTIDGVLYLAGSATAAADKGQTLTPTTAATLGTEIVAKALDSVPVPATTGTYKVRCYIDRLSKSVLVL